MSDLTERTVRHLVREGTIPPEHAKDCKVALEIELRRRSRGYVAYLAREAVDAVALSKMMPLNRLSA